MASPAPWRDSLLRRQIKKDGKTFWQVLPCQANATTILRHHPAWKGVLVYNEFAQTVVTVSAPPWGPDEAPTKIKPGPWTDTDTHRLTSWFARNESMQLPRADVEGAIEVTARGVAAHPVKEWLSSLKWDGKKRLDGWLVQIGGAKDSDYTRAVGAKWMISAVARVFEPGCKADHLPIFEGAQGIGKSTLLHDLAGEEWFLETAVDLSSVEAQKVLANKWIVELSELDSLTRSEVSRVKGFLSERVSTFRASYGHRPIDHPRQCVFAGTTNSAEYLKDDSGARRFWPVKLTKVDLKRLRTDRTQLWAEATARYKAGEKWHLEDVKLIKAAAEEAETRRQKDPWEDIIAGWLARHPSLRTSGVTTHTLLTEAVQRNNCDLTRADEMRVAGLLRTIGWEHAGRSEVATGRQRIYRPASGPIRVVKGSNKGDGNPIADLLEVGQNGGRLGQVGHLEARKQASVQPVQPVQPFLSNGGKKRVTGGSRRPPKRLDRLDKSRKPRES